MKDKKGLTCPHCVALGIQGMSKLMLHVDRMHSRPYTCNICKVEFVDRYHFNMHSPSCYFMCPLDGCNFQDKRESRLNGHLRKHNFKIKSLQFLIYELLVSCFLSLK